MTTLAELESTYGQPGEVEFSREGDGITTIRIYSELASAVISLQGGQILAWRPEGHEPVLWLSEYAMLKPGKAIRGGSPICWPWFGVNEELPKGPAHGFARTSVWELKSLEKARGGWELVLKVALDELQQKLWSYNVEAELSIAIGQKLSYRLSTHNKGTVPVTITQAIHTYFYVSDINHVTLEGFDNRSYIDKLLEGSSRVQIGDLCINEEVDRIFLDHEAPVSIVDRGLSRRIKISKSGSKSYVIWNPWVEKSNQLGDMGIEGYRHMVCVETANAAVDSVCVAPGSKYEISTEYTVEAL